MTRSIVAVLIAMGTVAKPGQSQEAASAKCVIDSAAARLSAVLTLWVEPSTELTDTSVNAVMERTLITEMEEAFQAPSPLDLWPWPGTNFPEGFEIRSMGGQLRVTIRDGRMMAHDWVIAPRNAPFKVPIELALERAAASDAFHAAVMNLPQRSAQLTLRFKATSRNTTHGVALYQVRLSFLRIANAARRIDGPAPKYPRSLYRQNGSVDLEFVIGDLGRIVPGSAWVTNYTDPGFVASARTAVEGSTFAPATVRGCPAGQMVQQRVSFEAR